jgi:hypothetical protein
MVLVTCTFFIKVKDYTTRKKLEELFIGFWALMAVTVKNVGLWVVMPCSSETAWCFGGTYRLCLQGQRISLSCQLLLLVSCVSYSTTMKIEAVCSSSCRVWPHAVVCLYHKAMLWVSFTSPCLTLCIKILWEFIKNKKLHCNSCTPLIQPWLPYMLARVWRTSHIFACSACVPQEGTGNIWCIETHI